MKTLKCADLGIACDFSVTSETNEEITSKMNAHISEAHANMSEEQKAGMATKIDEALKEQETKTTQTDNTTTETTA